MLPKKRRIRRKEFSHILQSGKRYNSAHLLLYVAEGKDKPSGKVSFSVSKKVLSLASQRNKYRRWGYSVIEAHKDPLNAGFYFFSFKKGSSGLKFKELEKEIKELLSSSLVIR